MNPDNTELFKNKIVEEIGDDVNLAYAIARDIVSKVRKRSKPTTEDEKKRYIKQEELTRTCFYLLEGYNYDDALKMAAEEVESNLSDIQIACNEVHKVEYLNNMYDRATSSNISGFRKMKESGYLTKAEYKGKVRPKTGLKKIERAVNHKNHHESLQKQVDMLQNKLDMTGALSCVTANEVNDIQKYLGLGFTLEEKIDTLLRNGYKPKMICDLLGCSKFKVSRVKNTKLIDDTGE